MAEALRVIFLDSWLEELKKKLTTSFNENATTDSPSSTKMFVSKSTPPQSVKLCRAQPEPETKKVGKPWGHRCDAGQRPFEAQVNL